MNRLMFLYLGVLLGSLCTGQSLSPTVITTTGGYQRGARAALSYTIGEVATATYSGERATLTQGFQQTSLVVTALSESVSRINVEVYPNPTAEWLNVVLPEHSAAIHLTLADSRGALLQDLHTSGERSVRISVAKYPVGMYYLRIADSNWTSAVTYSIAKAR